MSKPERLLKTEDLMYYFSVHRHTVLAWRKEGMPYLKHNQTIRFQRADVLAWVNGYYDPQGQSNAKSATEETNSRDNLSTETETTPRSET